jgi:hypothetical protein
MEPLNERDPNMGLLSRILITEAGEQTAQKLEAQCSLQKKEIANCKPSGSIAVKSEPNCAVPEMNPPSSHHAHMPPVFSVVVLSLIAP